MGLTSARGTETDEGYEHLCRAILRGEVGPNERLIELDLARRWGGWGVFFSRWLLTRSGRCST